MRPPFLIPFVIPIFMAPAVPASRPAAPAPSDPSPAKALIKYEGREKNAQWRFDALERIEKTRKADLEIRLLTMDQKPVSGATVTVRQTRQDFGWGTAVTAKWITDPSPEGERYRETLKKYFNKVVLENDLTWGHWENAASRASTSNAIAWLRANGFHVRGHCLLPSDWSHLPKSLRLLENDKPALVGRLHRRLEEVMLAFKGQLAEWDVVNEPCTNQGLMDLLGAPEMVDGFKLARQIDPTALLWWSDRDLIENGDRQAAHQESLANLLALLKARGAPVDGLGFQAHFKAPLTPPYRVLEILDRYARMGLKIQVTEFDIATEDEAGQADYTRDLMTLLFSHPAAVGFVNGGFWEKSHGIPGGSYFRGDGSLKPNGKVWEELVTQKWRTDAQGKTDANGFWSTRGFLGNYEIIVQMGEKRITQRLSLDAGGLQLVLPFK